MAPTGLPVWTGGHLGKVVFRVAEPRVNFRGRVVLGPGHRMMSSSMTIGVGRGTVSVSTFRLLIEPGARSLRRRNGEAAEPCGLARASIVPTATPAGGEERETEFSRKSPARKFSQRLCGVNSSRGGFLTDQAQGVGRGGEYLYLNCFSCSFSCRHTGK